MTTQTPDGEAQEYLLIKNGLYYMPGSNGYIGVKDLAGRFHRSDAMPEAGVEAVHEDDAPDYSPKCWSKVKEDHEAKKKAEIIAERDAARARVSELEAALTPSDETKIRHWGEHTYLVDQLYIDEDGEEAEMTVKLVVPWTAVKEIMKSIVDHALTKDNSNG